MFGVEDELLERAEKAEARCRELEAALRDVLRAYGPCHHKTAEECDCGVAVPGLITHARRLLVGGGS